MEADTDADTVCECGHARNDHHEMMGCLDRGEDTSYCQCGKFREAIVEKGPEAKESKTMTEFGQYEREIQIGRAKGSGSNVVVLTRPGFVPQVAVGNERIQCYDMDEAFCLAMNWVDGAVRHFYTEARK